MKLKTVEIEGKTYAEIKDGKPVYVDDDGKETAYDAPAMHQTIGKLNREAQGHREAKEELESKVKAFEGIDPEKAQQAIKTLKNLDDKKLIDAGEVERVKQETAQAYQKQLEEAKKQADELQQQYAGEKINAAFSGSKFVTEKLAIPPDMAQATFGRHFKFDNGRISPVDQNGNPIYSDSNPGDVANFDEALEKIVSQYPHRDRILKGSGQSGSGSGPVDSGGRRTVTREQFESMRPDERQKFAASAAKGEVQITD